MVDTRNVKPRLEPYVIPSQFKHVFYVEFLGKQGWSYVDRYDPRGRPIKYNVAEKDEIEEEDDVEEQGVHVLDEDVEEDQGYVSRDNVKLDELDDIDVMSNEELEEIKPNVEDHVPDGDIDDDVDMVNPLNMYSKLDDIDDELDEEEN